MSEQTQELLCHCGREPCIGQQLLRPGFACNRTVELRAEIARLHGENARLKVGYQASIDGMSARLQEQFDREAVAHAQAATAEAALTALRATVTRIRSYVRHTANCSQHRGNGGTCFAPGPVSLTWGAISCRLTIGHDGNHANGSHEWADATCTCGLTDALAALTGKETETPDAG